MKKVYKLEFFTRFIINLCIVLLFCMLLILSYQALSAKQDDIIPMIVVFIVVIGLLGFITKTKFDLMKDKFDSVVIDNEAKLFSFSTKNGEIYSVKFEDIDCVYMTSGELLKGVYLGHINVITKGGICFSLAITNIKSFCVNLPREINRNLEEYIFFRVKKWR